MVPRVGQQIGPYEILGRLGSGGMGLVFSAWDARLQRDVAIKLLREEYATPTMRSRFQQEARAASGLNHPNICTVFDIGEVSGDPYLVMELLKGETLRARISRGGRLPSEDIHRIGSEVLDALGVAHARGVIHRDIKPANIILVNKAGGGFQAKVLDFGLAKVEIPEQESSHQDLTTIGTTVGTVSYMSPEQARGEPVDARSDLFSLGSVLYEAATGALPFQGATSALIFVELLGKNPTPVRQQNAAIPRDLDRFITRLLAKAPADRFQSAKLALEALRSVSLRKSPFEGLALWGGKGGAAKSRPDASPEVSPDSLGSRPEAGLRASEPPALPAGIDGTFLRPARRGADPLAARVANPPAGDADRSPQAQEPLAGPPARPAAPVMGAVVVRPLKPDAVRASLPPAPRPVDAESGPVKELAFNASPESTPPAPPITTSHRDWSPSLPAEIREPPGITPQALHANEEAAQSPTVASHEISSPGSAESFAGIPPRPQAAEASPDLHRLRWGWLLVALSIPPAAAVLAWYFNSHRTSQEATRPVSIVLAGTENGTDDASLGTIFATGLSFAAAQSPHLSVRTAEDYSVALRGTGHTSGSDVSVDQARAAGRGAGAGVLVFGAIRGQGAPYQLSLLLFDVASGKRLSQVAEKAAGREQIPEALDRLAADMRSALGESHDFLSHTTTPLGKDASANLDALLAFGSGAKLQAVGNSTDAILAFQHAASLDPRFTEAYLRLAGLYRERHAGVAAAHAADQAQINSGSASPRTRALAQATYAMDASEEYGQAIDLLIHSLGTYPGDLQTLDALSLAQMLAGKFPEAQATAERALQLSHFDAQAIAQQELAFIAQGRPESVASVEAHAGAAAVTHPGIAALAAAASVVGTEMLLPPADAPLPPETAAALLDAAGHFSEGAGHWQIMADSARSTPELLSAAAYANAMSALNRALAGDCGSALPLALAAQSLPSGMSATFGAGEAQALCGNLEGARRALVTLNESPGRSSAAQTYLSPDLSATIAWKSGDTDTALSLLDGAREFDAVSLTAYLRGLVQIAARQPQLSIVQFQAILGHRGPTTLFNPEVYPLAQLGLARAYAASGDLTNSSVAYGRFLELWSSADPGLSAVAEARSHAHL